MVHGKKILLSLVALVTVIASVALTLGLIGNMVRSGLAQPVLSATVTATDYYIPSGSDPWGTAFDSHGNVWVAIPSCDPSPTCSNSNPGKIAEFNPGSSSWSATYQLPSGYAQPLLLAFDSQGFLWFTMPMNNSIGKFDPSAHTFQQWAVPTASSGPWGITVDQNSKIWFTEHYTNKIGRFDPSNQSFMEVATPASNSQPYSITVDAYNNIWFTENNSSVALIAEYTTQGKLNEYKIRTGSTSGLTPHMITVDPNGNIWWSEGWPGKIGELVVSLAQPGTNNGVTEYAYQRPCSTCGAHTSGISVDSNGLVWFDDSLQSIFGSFPDSGSGSFALYSTPTSNSHPHDGLRVDRQNRIWFDEEFANKLARAVQSGVPSPTASPSPSPTPTTTPTPTPSPTITPSATPGTTLAQDNFQRANQTYWGTASDGPTWASDANSSSVFSINANTGKLANGSSSYSAVLGPTAADAEVLFTGSMSSFSNTNMGAVLRWTDGNNWYKAYIDGTNLVLQKKVNGTTTILATVSFSATAGTSYTLRFRVVGTTLYAKVWNTGNTEPGSWMLTQTDSTFQSGYCGLRILVQGSATATITSFVATAQ
jgi:streptogramin lyase